MGGTKYISSQDVLHLLSNMKVPGHDTGLKRQGKSMEIGLGNYDQSGDILEFSVNNYWRKEGGSNERVGVVASWERMSRWLACTHKSLDVVS